MTDELEFTTNWFSEGAVIPLWKVIFETWKPKKILEIGSFEGRSTCWMIAKACEVQPNTHIDIYCLDSWEGGIEHEGIDFDAVEKRFDSNVTKMVQGRDVDIHKVKGTSMAGLSSLLVKGGTGFDLVYVDGSHESCDVLADAIMSFPLLRIGAVMIFDDYNSPNDHDDPNFPRLGIDSFLKCYIDKWRPITFLADGGRNLYDIMREQGTLPYQLYIYKTKN